MTARPTLINFSPFQNKRNGMIFDLVLTSDIIGSYKPDIIMYKTALRALGHEKDPGSVAMVAAHAYDLEAAAQW
jgi:2-haloacid dehalogenase